MTETAEAVDAVRLNEAGRSRSKQVRVRLLILEVPGGVGVIAVSTGRDLLVSVRSSNDC